MKKIKNKFIISVIIWAIWIIALWVFGSNLLNQEDRSSYVTLIDWDGVYSDTLNEHHLALDEPIKLDLWYIVKTWEGTSLALIEWGDWSVTRMWPNSMVQINELAMKKDLSEIQVSFELMQGKTWSNVISYLWDESYFKETFQDNEAAVRGTVFNLDLDKQYLYVQEHEVKITTADNSVITVPEKQPLSLSSFDFIKFAEFILKVKDRAWEDLNSKYDDQYLLKLQESLITSFTEDNLFQHFNKVLEESDFSAKITEMSEWEKNTLYDQLISDYQKVHSITSEQTDLFAQKMQIKEVLLQLAPQEEKESLVRSTLYDMDEVLKNKNFDDLQKIFPLLESQKDILTEMNVQLKDYINLDVIPEDLRKILKNNFFELKDFFWSNIELFNAESVKSNFGNITNGATDIMNQADSKVKDTLDDTKNAIENFIINNK